MLANVGTTRIIRKLPSLACIITALKCSYVYYNETCVSMVHCATGTLFQLLKFLLFGITSQYLIPPKAQKCTPYHVLFFSNIENLPSH